MAALPSLQSTPVFTQVPFLQGHLFTLCLHKSSTMHWQCMLCIIYCKPKANLGLNSVLPTCRGYNPQISPITFPRNQVWKKRQDLRGRSSELHTFQGQSGFIFVNTLSHSPLRQGTYEIPQKSLPTMPLGMQLHERSPKNYPCTSVCLWWTRSNGRE